MAFDTWLRNFVQLHERARTRQLSGNQLAEYLVGRDELARAVLRSQNLLVQPGQKPRQALRVAVALPVQLEIQGGTIKTLTRDLSIGGLSATVPGLSATSGRGRFSLSLGREGEPVQGGFQVVGTTMVGTSCRMSVSFHDLSSDDIERLELLIFDSVVARLQPSAPPKP